MAHTLFEAAKLSRNPLARGVLKAIATTDEMLAVLPMVPKQGESFHYNREKSLPTVEFVAPDHTSLTESGATFDRVTAPIREMVSDVDVYLFAEEQQGDTNQQMATQIAQKLKAAGRKIGDKAINGTYSTSVTVSPAMGGVTANSVNAFQDSDRHGPGSLVFTLAGQTLAYRAPGDRVAGTPVAVGVNGTYTLESDNPSKRITVTIVAASLPAGNTESAVRNASTTNEPDGLNLMIPSGQNILSTGANGDALSFDVLDAMIDEKLKVRSNPYFVMNSKLKGKYFALVRALGGSNPEHIMLPGLNRQIPTYRGIPILQNDWIASTEAKGGSSTLSSVYLCDFSAEEGFYAGVSQRGGSVLVDGDPRQQRIMGIKIRDVGELEDKEARRTRISWYGNFALGSELAAVRASEIETA